MPRNIFKKINLKNIRIIKIILLIFIFLSLSLNSYANVLSFGIKYGVSQGGEYLDSNSRVNKLKNEDPSYQINLQYSMYTFITGIIYSKANLTYEHVDSSPGTTTIHKLEHEMIGISIGIEFENKLPQHLGMNSIFKVTPQIIIPQKSELKYQYKNSGIINSESSITRNTNVNYSVISVPGYFDWTNWYLGFEYIMYENNGINLRYATGEKESLNYSNGLYLIFGYKYGSSKKKRRRR